ncbi:hypothetical protein ACFQZF_03210 [Flavobacterium myungsuense]|uniref:DUF1189 domain-containing protein n=1 Tax=Flavobacterium myungsuense TaxID=651823 RepID=A0ABW3J4B9_9FLAO
MKLSQENIEFINSYLKNNQVVYLDIRFEMIDHIAAAIEAKMEVESLDFYTAFKNYMVLNKSALLKNNKTSTSFSWFEIGNYLKYLVTPIMIVIAFLLFITVKLTDILSYFSKSFTFNNLVFLLFVCIASFQVLYCHSYLKKRYYGIEKTSQILLLLYLILPIFSGDIYVSILLLFFLFGYLNYFIGETSKFKKHKYKYL